MSIVELVRQPQGDAGSRGPVRSFESAARALLDELWSGTLAAATPGDRWLVHRIEEALVGLDEIRQMAAGDGPEPPGGLGNAAGRASISAASAASIA